MRVVLDTNVLVSAFLSPYGTCAEILRLVLAKRVTLILDFRIYNEYRDVLFRPSFHLNNKQVSIVLETIYEFAENIIPNPVNKVFPDKDDRVFYEAAVSGKADYLITGNKKHFPSPLCKDIAVASPSELLQAYRSQT